MSSFLRSLWTAARRDKAAMLGGVIITMFIMLAVFGPLIAHLNPTPSGANAYRGPSIRDPLGTDALGQNVLAEIVLGTRPVMEIGLLAALLTVSVGVVIGLVTGYVGGVLDAVVMRITDVFLTIPGLPLIIVIASLVQSSNPLILALILSVTAWAGLARAVRSQALSLRSSDFLEAARLQGLPLHDVVIRQLLPNVGPYVAIHFLLDVTGAIYAEVGLFLLGIAPVSGTNWGEMINVAMSQGALFTTRSMYSLLAPMAAIVILQVAFVFFARALDVVFNPRLQSQ